MRWPWQSERAAEPPARKVAVFLDDSLPSERAWEWTKESLLDRKRDVLHLVAVATPPPMMAGLTPSDMLDVDVSPSDQIHAAKAATDEARAGL